MATGLLNRPSAAEMVRSHVPAEALSSVTGRGWWFTTNSAPLYAARATGWDRAREAENGGDEDLPAEGSGMAQATDKEAVPTTTEVSSPRVDKIAVRRPIVRELETMRPSPHLTRT